MRDRIEEIRSYILGDNRRVTLLYLLSLLYIGINCYLVYREMYWSLLLPLVLVIFYYYIFSLDKILLLITFLTPLAINIRQFEFNVGISLPTEPLMFGVLVMFAIKLLYRNEMEKGIWTHPMTIVIGLQLMWMLITSIMSDLPVVSLKQFLARLWFVVPFYLLGIAIFRKREMIPLFVWLYAISLLVVIGYTINHHAQWGFNEIAGHWVMEPFYNDHTIYGAVLAMFIPVFCGFVIDRYYSRTYRFFSLLVLGVLVLAIVLSYSRAAWLSLGAVFGILLLVVFKIRFRWLLVAGILVGTLFYFFSFEILDRLEKNQQGPSKNFVEHLRSVSNISTDNSNLERINRWQSAFRMFNERPVFGFGPGTYQFEYAPFQRSGEKTLISTNAGDQGNAHSEYIGPLAEQGFMGLLLMLLIVAMIVITGFKAYKASAWKHERILILSLLLGLLTYFIHGVMNNFLDTDKASVPVWGFLAAIVALHLYGNRDKDKEIKE